MGYERRVQGSAGGLRTALWSSWKFARALRLLILAKSDRLLDSRISLIWGEQGTTDVTVKSEAAQQQDQRRLYKVLECDWHRRGGGGGGGDMKAPPLVTFSALRLSSSSCCLAPSASSSFPF